MLALFATSNLVLPSSQKKDTTRSDTVVERIHRTEKRCHYMDVHAFMLPNRFCSISVHGVTVMFGRMQDRQRTIRLVVEHPIAMLMGRVAP